MIKSLNGSEKVEHICERKGQLYRFMSDPANAQEHSYLQSVEEMGAIQLGSHLLISR